MKQYKLLKIALMPLLLICFLSVTFSPTVQAQSTLDDGLVGYWNFNEDTGNIVADNSGFNHNGTSLNSPNWVTGKYNNGLDFNFNSQMVKIEYYYSPISFSYWAKINDTTLSTQSAGIFSYLSSGFTFNGFSYAKQDINDWQIYIDLKNGSAIRFHDEDLTLHPLCDNNWHMQTFVLNQNFTLSMYNDGELIDTFVSDYINPTSLKTEFYINPLFKGIIDEVRFYDRILTSSEVNSLYTYNPDFVEPTPTPTPQETTFSINYLNSFALIILALICIFLTLKPNVPILNFIFGVIVLGISAATAGQTDMLLWGYMPLLTVILAIVCMLSGYVSWKR